MVSLRINANLIYIAAGGVIGSSIIIVILILIYLYYLDKLDTASAFGIIIGAIANLFLAFATWMYLGEVRKQVHIMAIDVEGSKTKENNRLLSEQMTKLVAPLYFNKSLNYYLAKGTGFAERTTMILVLKHILIFGMLS